MSWLSAACVPTLTVGWCQTERSEPEFGQLSRAIEIRSAISAAGSCSQAPDDVPAGQPDHYVHGLIALNVALQLGTPVIRVGPGHVAVSRAGVPEAAVDEDRELLPREDDVGPDGQLRQPDL